MKKTLSFLLALVLVSALVLCPVSAMAEEETPAASGQVTYVAKNGETVTFNKYLVMKEDANVPNVTFSYSIVPGQGVPAAAGKAAVLAGPGPAVEGTTAPTVGTAAFTTADTKLSSKAEGDTVVLDEGENYVKKSVTIDFSGCQFDEPGVYRYVLTEQETAGAMGTSYDTQVGASGTAKQRFVDVYVQDVNNALQIQGYVIHETADDPAVGEEMGTTADGQDNKSDGFVNEYATQNLTISKTVSGNQGSKDKFFAFTVEISGAVAGTKYTVDLSNAQATSGSTAATIADNAGKSNPAELTANENGAVTQVFYLKHGQSIVIKGLAQGTGYAVSENAEDYKSTKTDSGNGTVQTADITVAFENSRSGAVPTGVMLTVIPGVVIVLIAGAAMVFLKKSKKEDNT